VRAVELSYRYGSRRVLDSVDLRIPKGQILGLLGPNGAGKSTLMKLLAGFLRPQLGRIEWRGEDISGWPVHRRVRSGLGILPQTPSLMPRMSMRANLALVADWADVDVDAELKRCELWERRDDPAAVLSGGLARRLEVSRALITSPDIALLDEPFSGVDPIHVTAILARVARARDHGTGILLSDHAVRETLSVCDRVVVVEQGRVLFEGTPSEVVAHPDVRHRYLGHDYC
jgi:lipopolysaccharide export system ATP-binding protein